MRQFPGSGMGMAPAGQEIESMPFPVSPADSALICQVAAAAGRTAATALFEAVRLPESPEAEAARINARELLELAGVRIPVAEAGDAVLVDIVRRTSGPRLADLLAKALRNPAEAGLARRMAAELITGGEA